MKRTGLKTATTTIGSRERTDGWEGHGSFVEVQWSAEWNYRAGDGAHPGGLVGMGCETGRDDEKPVHRVWVDAFELAAYQVTNAEYGRFLAETTGVPPPCWSDANFHHPK